MNIASTDSALSILQPLATSATGAVSASSDGASAATQAVGAAATSSISSVGSLFDQLKQLSQSDPTKFKEVMSDMAKSLRQDAKQATGADAQRLSTMADRFDKAAQSGSLSDAAPPAAGQTQHAHGHHGHHGHGGGSSAIAAQLQSAFTTAMSSADPTSALDPMGQPTATATVG